MKAKLINRLGCIVKGIADGVFPSPQNSIEKTKDENGKETTKVNYTRLASSVLGWLLFVGFLTGKVTFEQLLELLRMVF